MIESSFEHVMMPMSRTSYLPWELPSDTPSFPIPMPMQKMGEDFDFDFNNPELPPMLPEPPRDVDFNFGLALPGLSYDGGAGANVHGDGDGDVEMVDVAKPPLTMCKTDTIPPDDDDDEVMETEEKNPKPKKKKMATKPKSHRKRTKTKTTKKKKKKKKEVVWDGNRRLETFGYYSNDEYEEEDGTIKLKEPLTSCHKDSTNGMTCLKTHRTQHRENGRGRFVCKCPRRSGSGKCNKVYKRRYHWVRHVDEVHLELPRKPVASSYIKKGRRSSSPEE